jgi:hypothetical protein
MVPLAPAPSQRHAASCPVVRRCAVQLFDGEGLLTP